MKKINQMCLLLLLSCCLVGCNSTSEKKTDSLALAASNNVTMLNGIDGDCVAPSEWFSGSVPAPQPQNFPQGEYVSNCDFHLISWQYFLWLTEKVDGGKLRFETFYTDQAIHPETKDDTYQILDIVEQALSKGILVDQSGRAVYSNIMINDVYRDWVLDNELYDSVSYYNFGATNDFPVGSMSLKANWKILNPGENPGNLYTTTADIQLLSNVNGVPRIPENAAVQEGVRVALVALHIAVVVEGHPEFIWATFEFDENAPDFKEDQNLYQPVSDKDWLFYKANTTAQYTNANNAAILEFVDQSKQTLTPVTQVGRQYVNGGGKPMNQGNIEHLNADVKIRLDSQSVVWQNYFEVGAIWFDTTKGTLAPNWSPNIEDSMVTGSLQLSNSTIETFTQKIPSQNECFSCHNTMAVVNVPGNVKPLPGKNANTSHILLKNYQGGGEVKRSN